MLDSLTPPERAKLYSAYHAMEMVEDGMRVGLGTGSTAAWLVRLLGVRCRVEGLRITGVATSEFTDQLARRVGVPVTDLDSAGRLDLTIDGADEFDPDLRLIKGAGGALLREKIVATASDRMVVITDPSKEVAELGAFALPVEIVRFAWETTQALVQDVLERHGLGAAEVVRRVRDGEVYMTDEEHYILDLHLGRIAAPNDLARDLLGIAGVVETGLFLGIATSVVMADDAGGIREIRSRGNDDLVSRVDADRVQTLISHIGQG